MYVQSQPCFKWADSIRYLPQPGGSQRRLFGVSSYSEWSLRHNQLAKPSQRYLFSILSRDTSLAPCVCIW